MENWYINNEGQVFGPYTITQIKLFIQSDKLHSRHFLSTDKNNWLSLVDFDQKHGHLQETVTLNLKPVQKKMIGKYEVIQEIGRGGMGVVYHAKDSYLNRECAIKVILGANDENSRKRFLAEASAIAQLDHPNIVRVQEMGTFQDEYKTTHSYLAMDYVVGKSLEDIIQNKKIPLKLKLQIFVDICRGIEHAHSKNVIHRDLKPANIVVTSSNTPIILDFGLARKIDMSSDITKTGDIFGTPQYMAPENVRGQKIVSTRSDVYSLGVILYKIITNRVPFDGEDIMEILFQVTSKLPIHPSQLNANIKKYGDLEIICLKAIEKNPEKRIRSAKFLGDEIDRFLKNRPILTKTPLLLNVIWDKIKYDSFVRRMTVAFGILLTLCFILGYVLYYTQKKNQIIEEKNQIIEEQKKIAEEESLAAEKQKCIAQMQTVDIKLSKSEKNMIIINNNINKTSFIDVVREIKEAYNEFEQFVNAEENSVKQKQEYADGSLFTLQKLQMLLKFSVLPNLPKIKSEKKIESENEKPLRRENIIFSANAIAFYKTEKNLEKYSIFIANSLEKANGEPLFQKLENTKFPQKFPLMFSPDSKYLVLADKYSEIDFFDLHKNVLLENKIRIHNKEQMAFSPSSRYFAYKDTSGHLAVFDLQDNKKVFIPNNINILADIGALVFSADEEYLAFFIHTKNQSQENVRSIAVLHLKSRIIQNKEFLISHHGRHRKTLLVADESKNIFYCNTNFEINEYFVEKTKDSFTIHEKKFPILEQKGVYFETGKIKDKVLGFGGGREIFLLRKILHDQVETISSYKIKILSENSVLDFLSSRLLMSLENNGSLYLLDTASEKFTYHQSNILGIAIKNKNEALFISGKEESENEKSFFYNTLNAEPSLTNNFILSPENYDLYSRIINVISKENLASNIPITTEINKKFAVILPVCSNLGISIWQQAGNHYVNKLHLSSLVSQTRMENISMHFQKKYLALLLANSKSRRNPIMLVDLEKNSLNSIDNIFHLPEHLFPNNFTPNIKNIEFSKTRNSLYLNDQKESKEIDGFRTLHENIIYSYSLDDYSLKKTVNSQSYIQDIKASSKGFVAILYRFLDVHIIDENSHDVQKISWDHLDHEKITNSVDRMAVSPASKTIALCNNAGQVRIWEQKASGNWENYFDNDIRKKEEEKLDFAQHINNLSFSPDGRYLAVFAFDDIYIYDLHLKVVVRTYIGYYKGSVANFSEDWFFATLVSEDAQIIVFDQKYFIDQNAFIEKIKADGYDTYFRDGDGNDNVSYWPLRLTKYIEDFAK